LADRALIVMAKAPVAGRTKTRLSPPLSGQEAADLYRCLLLDTMELMARAARATGVQPVVSYHPPAALPTFARLAPPGFSFIAQVGADLGERLHNTLSECLRGGYRRVVVMDSDSPTLPVAYLENAFAALDGADVVLGPCEDGGYYLIGLKAPCAALFRGIVMSTATVLEETLQRAREQGLRAVCLPTWYDVDNFQALARFAADLAAQSDHQAPHTRAFLAAAGPAWGLSALAP
jgi:rSAM/selenodomain-associated transferase 1